MKNVTLTINKEEVMTEVAKTTSYTGSKMEDKLAYDRIFTTDEDKNMLERFWNECKTMLCNSLKKMLDSETEQTGIYTVVLSLSNSFDDNLTESMNKSMFSFFVMNITSKWFAFTNKSEATPCASEAATYMEDIMRKAFFKKRPSRPTY